MRVFFWRYQLTCGITRMSEKMMAASKGKRLRGWIKGRHLFLKKRDNLYRNVVISSQYTVILLPSILKVNKRIKMF